MGNEEKERKEEIMKKVLTVEEVLDEIRAKKKLDKNGVEHYVFNRFNKKTYEKLLLAMMNDPGLKMFMAKVKKNELETTDELMVTKGFREFLRKVLIKAGVDASDANAVMSEDFIIDSSEGLYEFFATSLWLYMESGNKFDLISLPDFKGSLFIDDVPESDKTVEIKDPKTGNSMGMYATKKKKHKVLKTKSSCPAWLASRRKVD